MTFIKIVYMKLPFFSLKTKDAYIRFLKRTFRIYLRTLFSPQYPKIDIYNFWKRLIIYVVITLTNTERGNSIHKTLFSKIVYSF